VDTGSTEMLVVEGSVDIMDFGAINFNMKKSNSIIRLNPAIDIRAPKY
jgi:hypothetical protein